MVYQPTCPKPIKPSDIYLFTKKEQFVNFLIDWEIVAFRPVNPDTDEAFIPVGLWRPITILGSNPDLHNNQEEPRFILKRRVRELTLDDLWE